MDSSAGCVPIRRLGRTRGLPRGRAATRKPDRHAVRIPAKPGRRAAEEQAADRCPIQRADATAACICAPAAPWRSRERPSPWHPGPWHPLAPPFPFHGSKGEHPFSFSKGRAATRKPDRHAVRIPTKPGRRAAEEQAADRCPIQRADATAACMDAPAAPWRSRQRPGPWHPGPWHPLAPPFPFHGSKGEHPFSFSKGRAATRKPDRHAVRIPAKPGPPRSGGASRGPLPDPARGRHRRVHRRPCRPLTFPPAARPLAPRPLAPPLSVRGSKGGDPFSFAPGPEPPGSRHRSYARGPAPCGFGPLTRSDFPRDCGPRRSRGP